MDDLGHRVVMRLRNELFRHLLDQSAAFFARRTTGALLSRINNDVGQLHRAVAETIGDLARESLALVGFARAAVLLRRRPGAAVHDGRAAGDLPARSPGPPAAHGDALEPGAARVHVPRGWRGVQRPPHRQGLRRGSARSAEVRACLAGALSHQPQGHWRHRAAAADDGVRRRAGDRRCALVRSHARSPRPV